MSLYDLDWLLSQRTVLPDGSLCRVAVRELSANRSLVFVGRVGWHRNPEVCFIIQPILWNNTSPTFFFNSEKHELGKVERLDTQPLGKATELVCPVRSVSEQKGTQAPIRLVIYFPRDHRDEHPPVILPSTFRPSRRSFGVQCALHAILRDSPTRCAIRAPTRSPEHDSLSVSTGADPTLLAGLARGLKKPEHHTTDYPIQHHIERAVLGLAGNHRRLRGRRRLRVLEKIWTRTSQSKYDQGTAHHRGSRPEPLRTVAGRDHRRSDPSRQNRSWPDPGQIQKRTDPSSTSQATQTPNSLSSSPRTVSRVSRRLTRPICSVCETIQTGTSPPSSNLHLRPSPQAACPRCAHSDFQVTATVANDDPEWVLAEKALPHSQPEGATHPSPADPSGPLPDSPAVASQRVLGAGGNFAGRTTPLTSAGYQASLYMMRFPSCTSHRPSIWSPHRMSWTSAHGQHVWTDQDSGVEIGLTSPVDPAPSSPDTKTPPPDQGTDSALSFQNDTCPPSPMPTTSGESPDIPPIPIGTETAPATSRISQNTASPIDVNDPATTQAEVQTVVLFNSEVSLDDLRSSVEEIRRTADHELGTETTVSFTVRPHSGSTPTVRFVVKSGFEKQLQQLLCDPSSLLSTLTRPIPGSLSIKPQSRQHHRLIGHALRPYEFSVVPTAYGMTATMFGRNKQPSDRDRNPLARLAPIVNTTLDYVNLFLRYPELEDDLAPLRDEAQFLKLIKPEYQGSLASDPGLKRSTSRGMLQHAQDLLDWNVVRLPFAGEPVNAMMPFFCVPKKDPSLLRLVVDCRKINRLLAPPPRMEIKSIHEVVKYVLSNKYLCSIDAKSYFYNFGLAPSISRYFGTHLSAQRGRVLPVLLTRMPMGLSWAPYWAQRTSNFLLRESSAPHHQPDGVAWLDNFLIGGSTVDEAHSKGLAFLRRASDINIPMDTLADELTPTSHATALGLEFDLEESRYRLDPSFIEKIPTLDTIRSRRSLFELIGCLVWSSYARHLPLCKQGKSIDILRRACQGTNIDWDEPWILSDQDKKQLDAWRTTARSNDWITLQDLSRPTFPLSFSSDASDTTCAFIAKLNDTLVAASVGKPPSFCNHIFLKEAFAVHKMVSYVIDQRKKRGDDTPISVALKCDNKGLVYAMKRQLSSSSILNEWMSHWVDNGIHIDPEWVSTKEQLADPLTRGVSLSDYIDRRLYDLDVLRNSSC